MKRPPQFIGLKSSSRRSGTFRFTTGESQGMPWGVGWLSPDLKGFLGTLTMLWMAFEGPPTTALIGIS
jgi:hypothetical protein